MHALLCFYYLLPFVEYLACNRAHGELREASLVDSKFTLLEFAMVGDLQSMYRGEVWVPIYVYVHRAGGGLSFGNLAQQQQQEPQGFMGDGGLGMSSGSMYVREHKLSTICWFLLFASCYFRGGSQFSTWRN